MPPTIADTPPRMVSVATTAATPIPRRGVQAAMSRPTDESTIANITAPASPYSRSRVLVQNDRPPSSAPPYRTSSGIVMRANSAADIAASFART